MSSLNLGLNEMECAKRGTCAGELSIRSDDDHITESAHCSGENVEPDRIDAVVIGQKNSHASIHSPST